MTSNNDNPGSFALKQPVKSTSDPQSSFSKKSQPSGTKETKATFKIQKKKKNMAPSSPDSFRENQPPKKSPKGGEDSSFRITGRKSSSGKSNGDAFQVLQGTKGVEQKDGFMARSRKIIFESGDAFSKKSNPRVNKNFTDAFAAKTLSSQIKNNSDAFAVVPGKKKNNTYSDAFAQARPKNNRRLDRDAFAILGNKKKMPETGDAFAIKTERKKTSRLADGFAVAQSNKRKQDYSDAFAIVPLREKINKLKTGSDKDAFSIKNGRERKEFLADAFAVKPGRNKTFRKKTENDAFSYAIENKTSRETGDAFSFKSSGGPNLHKGNELLAKLTLVKLAKGLAYKTGLSRQFNWESDAFSGHKRISFNLFRGKYAGEKWSFGKFFGKRIQLKKIKEKKDSGQFTISPKKEKRRKERDLRKISESGLFQPGIVPK